MRQDPEPSTQEPATLKLKPYNSQPKTVQPEPATLNPQPKPKTQDPISSKSRCAQRKDCIEKFRVDGMAGAPAFARQSIRVIVFLLQAKTGPR